MRCSRGSVFDAGKDEGEGLVRADGAEQVGIVRQAVEARAYPGIPALDGRARDLYDRALPRGVLALRLAETVSRSITDADARASPT
jgi:hypothetical protein